MTTPALLDAARLSDAGTPSLVGSLVSASFRELAARVECQGELECVLPYVDAQADGFYWELHFEDARLVRTDFLQRVPLSPPRTEGGPDTPLRTALAAWFREPEVASRCHPSAWFELDGPWNVGSNQRPQGVSVCLDPGFGTPAGGDPLVLAHSASRAGRLYEGLRETCGVPSDGGARVQQISDAAMTHGGAVRHLSVMRGRPDAPGKLYAAVSKPKFAAFLAAIRWPGDETRAERLLELVCADSVRVNCDLELCADLTERLGFELFYDPSPALDPLRRSATLLALRLGLISATQVASLEAWVGQFRLLLAGERWPTRVQRWFDLKFVTHAGGRLELKAYLGFRACGGIF